MNTSVALWCASAHLVTEKGGCATCLHELWFSRHEHVIQIELGPWLGRCCRFGLLVDASSSFALQGNPYHSRAFLTAYDGLPDTSNALFTGSGKCAGCHGTDPIAYANVTEDGIDINPTSPVAQLPYGQQRQGSVLACQSGP